MRLREIPNEVARSCASAGRAVTYSPRLECHADPLTATCEDATVTEPESTSTAPKLAVPRLLNGQKAIVTGANSGIGRGVALALGEAGADVVVNYIVDDGAAQTVVEQLEGFGVRALKIKADVSDEGQVAAMFAQTIEAFGTVDILVANAGLQRDSAFREMTLAEWNKVIGVNLTGQFLCAREAVREFSRRGVVPEVSCAAGKIICMSSVHQEIPWGGHANYASSKGGIKPLMTLVPYGRIGEPEDIARAAVWLASDQSDYVVGTTLFVDGGMTLYPGFATGG